MNWFCKECVDAEGHGKTCELTTGPDEEPLFCPMSQEFDIAKWESKVDIKLLEKAK